jgi:hypothetical protein
LACRCSRCGNRAHRGIRLSARPCLQETRHLITAVVRATGMDTPGRVTSTSCHPVSRRSAAASSAVTSVTIRSPIRAVPARTSLSSSQLAVLRSRAGATKSIAMVPGALPGTRATDVGGHPRQLPRQGSPQGSGQSVLTLRIARRQRRSAKRQPNRRDVPSCQRRPTTSIHAPFSPTGSERSRGQEHDQAHVSP